MESRRLLELRRHFHCGLTTSTLIRILESATIRELFPRKFQDSSRQTLLRGPRSVYELWCHGFRSQAPLFYLMSWSGTRMHSLLKVNCYWRSSTVVGSCWALRNIGLRNESSLGFLRELLILTGALRKQCEYLKPEFLVIVVAWCGLSVVGFL